MAAPSKKSAYEAFNAVDDLVSKPVLGSDGAGRWQNFRQGNKLLNRQSTAPTAPLKATDRKAGFGSWQQERQNEAAVRIQAGEAALNAGYTTFNNKADAEEAARLKREKQVRKRIRPDDVTYYCAAETFQGPKFDYVFTTKESRTGYYWDGMESVKKMDRGGANEEDAPLSASTNADSGGKLDSSAAAAATAEGEAESTRQQPSDGSQKLLPIKKKRKKEKPVMIDDPNNPMEQVAAALQRRQQQVTVGAAVTGRDWEAAVDPSTGKMYYYCRTTGDRAWEKPPAALPEGWQSAVDATTGKEYFFNAVAGETRWERPPY